MSIFGGGSKSAATTPTKAMGLDLQSAQYGAPIPVIFGQNKVAGNVIWYGDFQAIGHQQKQPGKGGGGGSSGTTYTYSSSYMLGLTEGPASIVSVYDGSSIKSLASVGGIGFTGTLGQAPWAHLSGAQALGYSGTSLAAFQNKDLGGSASLPNYNFEMAGRNQFGSGILDANPADIVTAISTDTQIGVTFNALGDLTQFRTYCTAAGLFFSPAYATQQSAQQTLDDLFKYSNSAPYFSEGVLKVVPYGDAVITGNGATFTPNVTAVADLGRDDFITNGPGDPVTVKRIGPADAMNIVRVEYKDRANTYHTGTVIASIDQDVVGTGARADQTESVDMITTAPVARLVAQNILQRIYYIRNTYEFQLSWRYCYLEPMDVVTLTDANTGLYLTPVRITEISEDEHGLLSVVAEEFPDGVSHGGIYATQANAGATVDTNADPGPIDGPYLFRGPGFLVSNNQPEIWCALAGNDPMWAGCDVYMSHDGTSYTYLATHSRRASYGMLTNALPSVADPDSTSAPNVVLNGPAQLLGGTTADADQFITLAMVDQEIISYQTATLAGGPSYTLGYLRRGGYGSAIAAHAINAPFVRLDENILRIPVDPSQIGQTIYLKFVSFNVFGKGGRTLAGETAYTYVIGTNVELPDVPITPAGFTAAGVADGVSLTWTNPNPAAVGCTSIEYATASGGPWTVLAQVGPTATSFPHHFTTGATYFYRARSRGPLVSAGFSAYTATVSNTGTNVGAISNAAAQAQASAIVQNSNFTVDLTAWTFSASPGPVAGGEFFQEALTGSPYAPIPTYLVHTGQAGQTSAYADNASNIPVQPGQQVIGVVALRSLSANSTARAQTYLKFFDASGTYLGFIGGSPALNPSSGPSQLNSTAKGSAPANAAFVRISILYTNHVSGYITATCARITPTLSNLDDLPDLVGGSYRRTAVMPGSSISVANANFEAPIDPQGNIPGWVPTNAATLAYNTASPYSGANSLEITGHGTAAFGANSQVFQCAAGDVIYAQCQAYAVSGNAAALAVVFLGASGVLSAPNVANAPGYGAWYLLQGTPAKAPAGTIAAYVEAYNSATSGVSRFDEFHVSRNDVRVAGSGARIGDQRNLTAVTFGNYGSGWSGLTLTYTATTTSATISASAATLQAGGVAIAYNASSITLSGTAGSVVTSYLYYADATLSGGAKTLQATTNQITALSNDGYVLLGKITVTYPTSGTGGGGGGPSCPDENAWVLRADSASLRPDWCVRARTIRAGHYLRLTDGRIGLVTYSERKASRRVRVANANGKSLTCSISAPLELFDAGGDCILAPDSTGLCVSARADGVAFGSMVSSVEDAGDGYVQHITCQNACFWTGDEPDYLFGHHNLKP